MAADAGGPNVQRLRDVATCSICLEYFKDPVIIPECGHNFCRSCLTQFWGESEAEASCPQCKERVQRRSLIPNRQLAKVLELMKNVRDQKGEERKRGLCEEHQEPLKRFCKVHEDQKVVPLEEYKGKICRLLEILRKEREDLEKESKELLELTETQRLKTVEMFRELRQFLEEQEKRLLNDVEEVEKEIAGRRDEQLARLSRKLSYLERIIQEMEDKRQQPASEFLQDVRSTLQRYEKRENSEKPLAFPPDLRNRILESCDVKALVEDTMKQWKDAVLFGKQIQKANVSLDPDTAHPELILSEDRKSVRCGDKKQSLPDNPERFIYLSCVLGREGFRAGRHFWEVNVEREEMWDLGVARKSVERKGDFDLSPEGGIWAVGKWFREYNALTSPHLSPLFPREKPRRIRVTLDYEGGRVSFSDADSGAELYTFSGASFSGETLLPFFHVLDDENTLSIS